MGHEMARSDRGGDVRIRQPEVRQVRLHRPIELQPALVHQPHRRCRRKGLGDRPDLKERVRVDGQRVIHIRDAERGGVLDAVVKQPDSPRLARGDASPLPPRSSEIR